MIYRKACASTKSRVTPLGDIFQSLIEHEECLLSCSVELENRGF